MRYSAEHKQQTRDRIVKAAARRFRSRGAEGAAIAALMRDLRLTHGGFYRHFGKKEDLFVEAFAHALQESAERIGAAVARAPKGGELKALIDTYLSLDHCDHAGEGCPVAALASEVARRPAAGRAAILRILTDHVARVARYLPGDSEAERTRKAGVLLSGMAGTLSIARAFGDPAQRRRLLDDARRFYFHAMSG
jgi:TetR/AcrR family transcriptional repressor of nem operon